MEIQIYDSYLPMGTLEKKQIVDFLHQHLDEFGDTKEAIKKAIEYAVGESSVVGGYVLVGSVDGKMAGAVVVNRTGMEEYIPENILVYIAVDAALRGQGIGKQLMKKSIELAKGNVALHVEPNNPARFLYEKVGFTNKYLEYRLIKN
ncbi:MAG: GNAT family N-acetyltransferase [Bacteroidetes bacterium]|jgi:ribosomal-protein-alanine N-acetyltransferase|nr:GNAT family N-acetyltransferase [Bacteroidota bacterium]MBU1580763.1 GNAT family N-acetyltransferase [Bacteroidota bacterium]MBU2558152.1 GNAT family N-acetyltransferase [Bacteroidota bacterium]MDA3943361.1 GNAT family N-acetyltransferase [Bacteroidota bacterium]